ncbi:MAG: tetratricopeptide repeat protein [Candidatus Obscuribacter sp.]|nr:tetratricopeptide repeat protein [Candidatus Obscuribacter sp.]
MENCFQDVLWLLAISTPFFFLLKTLANVRFDEPPAYRHPPEANNDLILQLYNTARELYEQGQYQAAAATARVVMESERSQSLALKAANLAGLCELASGDLQEAETILRQGLEQVTQCSEASHQEMLVVRLMFLTSLALLYIREERDEQAWAMLNEALPLAEAQTAFKDEPEFKTQVLGPIYHYLGVLHEDGLDWSVAAGYYQKELAIWPADEESFSERVEAAQHAYMRCARNAAWKMFDGI